MRCNRCHIGLLRLEMNPQANTGNGSALKEAGEKGVTVKELSAKLKAEYRNIQVWFATTGKKNKQIKKIAPATYRLV